MPRKNSILNLPGFSIRKVIKTNPILIEVEYKKAVRCIHCQGKKLQKKSNFIRKIRHESMGLRPMYLFIKAYKFYCSCCNKYFNQRFPGICKYQRATEHLKRQVFHHHTQGASQKDLARDLKLGKATIVRWYHERYFLEEKIKQNRHLPRVLGIDEHFFNHREGFVTTFKNKIFDMVKGRSEKELADYLPNRKRVKVICIDLSSHYRRIIKKYFPHAKIVADRFHVIRLMNHMFIQACHTFDPKIKYQRGILHALKMKPENLTTKRMCKKDEYLETQPLIKEIYYFKQKLHLPPHLGMSR